MLRALQADKRDPHAWAVLGNLSLGKGKKRPQGMLGGSLLRGTGMCQPARRWHAVFSARLWVLENRPRLTKPRSAAEFHLPESQEGSCVV